MKLKQIVSFLLIFFLLGTALTGCSENVAAVVDPGYTYISSVKNGTNSSYPDVTYGEAFDSFFTNPDWTYFVGTVETDEDGDGITDSVQEDVDIVQFTGNCFYQNVEVTALIQFQINDDGNTFDAIFLSFNDVPQSKLVMGILITKVLNEASDANSAAEAEASSGIEDEPIVKEKAELPDAEEVQAAYEGIIKEYFYEFGDTTYFAIYDMNQDDIDELIISYGDTSADWTNEVFTYRAGDIYFLGTFDGLVNLYASEDGNGIYSVYGHMGYQLVEKISVVDDVLEIETLVDGIAPDDNYYENDCPITLYLAGEYYDWNFEDAESDDFDSEWYKTYSMFTNTATNNVLEIYYLDWGEIDFSINTITLYSCMDTDYTQDADGGYTYYCDDGTRIRYYPDDRNSVQILDGDYCGYYYPE